MNYFWAFCVGGAICVVGQLLIDLTGLTRPVSSRPMWWQGWCFRPSGGMPRWPSLPEPGPRCRCWASGICWPKGCALPLPKRVLWASSPAD